MTAFWLLAAWAVKASWTWFKRAARSAMPCAGKVRLANYLGEDIGPPWAFELGEDELVEPPGGIGRPSRRGGQERGSGKSDYEALERPLSSHDLRPPRRTRNGKWVAKSATFHGRK